MDQGSAQPTSPTAPAVAQPVTPPPTVASPPAPTGPTIGTEKTQKKPINTLFGMMGAFILVFLLGIAFEKFHIVSRIKSIRLPKVIIVMPSPTPAASTSATPTATQQVVPDTMADWKTYANEKYAYEFRCPQTSTHSVELALGDGNSKPYYQEICYDNQNQVRLYVYPVTRTQMASEGAILKDFVSTSKKERIFLRGFNQSYFDQVLSTFKLTEQKTATGAAYTCPAGNYINCVPSPDGMVKKECSAAAFTWYKANCPNFKGGAL